MPPKKTTRRAAAPKLADSYQHKDTTSPMRPEVGAQAHFKKKLPPQKYRYDYSLSPALDWDSKNPARDQGECAKGNRTSERLKELRDQNER